MMGIGIISSLGLLWISCCDHLHKSLCIDIWFCFSEVYRRGGMAGWYSKFMLNFVRNWQMLSKAVIPIYIPASNVGAFSTSLVTVVIVFVNSYFNELVMAFSVTLFCIFLVTHSSILAWRIPWTEEPGGLQFMGLQRVRHDWATNTFTLSVTNVVEHLYLLAVHVSSLVKCHFSSFAHLLIGLFIFLFNCEALCTHTCTYIYKNRHMLVIPPLWDIRFTNIFSSTFSFS